PAAAPPPSPAPPPMSASSSPLFLLPLSLQFARPRPRRPHASLSGPVLLLRRLPHVRCLGVRGAAARAHDHAPEDHPPVLDRRHVARGPPSGAVRVGVVERHATSGSGPNRDSGLASIQSGPPYGSTSGSGGASTCPRSRTTTRGTGRGGPGRSGAASRGRTTTHGPCMPACGRVGRLRLATLSPRRRRSCACGPRVSRPCGSRRLPRPP